MSRFISVENLLINVDHIVKVVDHDNGTLTIYLDTGEQIKADDTPELDITGSLHTSNIVPCSGVWAVMERDGQEFTIPVRHLLITADGEYQPLEPLCIDDDFSENLFLKGMTTVPPAQGD